MTAANPRRFSPIAGLVAVVLLAFPAFAETSTVHLDRDRLAALAAAPAISGPAASTDALKGKAVLVSFFASWCPPCHKEFRDNNALHAKYADKGLRIVAINSFENFGGFADGGKRLKRFLGRYDPEYTVIEGGKEIETLFGKVMRIPTVFVFAPNGEATLHFVHAQGATKMTPTSEELETAVRRALGIAGQARLSD